MTSILLAADFYYPFLGGVELQTRLLARELAARGHRVTVATVWHQGLPEADDEGGVAVRRLRGLSMRLPWAFADPGRRRYHPPFPDPLIARGLARLISATGAEVVDATGWISYSARLAAGRSGVPLILSARDFGFTCPTRTLVRCGRVCSGPGRKKCLRHAAANYGPPKGLAAATGVLGLRRWLLAGSAGVHVASRFVADIEKRDFIGNSSHRMVLVPDMVRPDTDEEVVTALDDAAGRLLDRLPAEPFILFVGALQLHKGLAPLLASHAALRNPPPLVVVGTSWPDSPKSWPAGVTALTDVPNPVVRRIWDRALFGVAPSLVPETFGNVVLEAMWHSRAMIASAIGGPLDTVADGETGFLVPPGDVAALTEAMQKLADDAALRDRMGAAARKRVAARFVPSVVIPEFERLYAEAAAGTQRR